MRAITAFGADDLRVVDVPDPTPAPGEILVRPTHAGICGSDLHYVRHGRVGDFVLRDPLILGHEIVGRVVVDTRTRADGGVDTRTPEVPDGGVDTRTPEVSDGDGAGAVPLAPGTPVAIHPAVPCNTCPQCRAGRRNICAHARYLGSAASTPHTQGGMCELMALPADRVVPLPRGLPLERAVLAEPLAVALHAAGRAGSLFGASVLVTGAGPIGLLAVRAAVRAGASTVAALDLQPGALALAGDLGARRTYLAPDHRPPAEAHDVVLEATGAPPVLATALQAVRRGGTVVQIGLGGTSGGPGADLGLLAPREITLRGTFRFDRELIHALDLLAEDADLARVVTHTYEVAELSEAFSTALDPARSAKVVLCLWEG